LSHITRVKYRLNEILEIVQGDFFFICSEWKKFFDVDEIKFYC